MSFNAIRENKILMKISESTVVTLVLENYLFLLSEKIKNLHNLLNYNASEAMMVQHF